MGFQIVGLPDIIDRGLADPLTLGHQPATPMCHSLRFGLQGSFHDGGNLVDVIGGLAPASWGDLPQSIQSLLGKARAPQNDRLAVYRQPLSNRNIRLTLGGRQYDTAMQGHLLRRTVSGKPLLKLITLGRAKARRKKPCLSITGNRSACPVICWTLH